MKYIDNTVYQQIKFSADKKEKYYQDIITFDIESTSYNENISFMYIWAINVNGSTYYGRSWDEFKQFINTLNTFETDKKFVIWVHNLSFEFRFLECILPFDRVFATSAHKVIYAICKNVMFRCSYYMSGLPLYKLYSSYKLKTPKLVGGLDYTKIRHKSSYLSPQELAYVENDAVLLYEYVEYMLHECGGFEPSKMPLTATGFTRKYLRDKAAESNTYGILRTIVKEASPRNMELYNLLRRCFAGGFVHANWIYLKQTINNVKSLDKTSFYPAIMCKEKFPRHFHKMKSEKFNMLIKNKDYAVIADVAFYGLKARTNHTIISKHKCSYIKNKYYGYNNGKEKTYDDNGKITNEKKGKPPIFDNGRVRSADILVISITDLDYDSICKFYTFDYIRVGRVYASRKRYLPKVIIETVLDLFARKTELKDVEDMEILYRELKKRLNALFGVCVSDILQPLILYMQDVRIWVNEPLKGTELTDYIDKYTSIQLYQTGVYITAWARHEILEHTLHCGDDTIYNDTDSIKLVNYEKHKKYFDEYNEKVKKQLEKVCEYYDIDKNKLNPVDIYGKHHFLGVLSDEGTYTKFKTLGCKRYIYEIDGILHSVVAGMPKQKMVDYLQKFNDPFDAFCSQLVIPAECTGKNTHYYTEPHEPMEITDYMGKKEVQEIYTGISLIPQKFEMNLSAEFSNFLKYRYSLGITHEERFTNLSEMTKRSTIWE